MKKELKKFFTPEFLNRVDEIVIFNSLVKEDVKKIVKLELDILTKRLVGMKYNITFDGSVLDLISDVGFDETYGARPIKRAIQEKIEDFISDEVLRGKITNDMFYNLEITDGEVSITETEPEPQETPKPKRARKKKGE